MILSMLDVDDLTTEELLRAWRDAEIEVNGTAIGTAEHATALQRSEKACDAYRLRLEAMKDDLRDG
jgi:hypothetical protein